MIDYRIGDTRDVIATIPDNSVHLVACSPPFVALRSYLPADHPDKHREIGSEPDPATFIDTLLALTAEWGRVLAPWGSIAIELGDTYAGGQTLDKRAGEGGKVSVGNADLHGTRRIIHSSGSLDMAKSGDGWPRAKCLALVPQAYAMSLAYGRNVLNGNDSPAGQWLVRNMIVWHRPNPAVGALGDKFRPSTSYITVATRSDKRWFDLTAVRTEGSGQPSTVTNVFRTKQVQGQPVAGERVPTPAGAPPLDAWFDQHDTWTLTTQPSRLAHYAMWPAKLAERLVLSMCPREVCATCGEPRKRIENHQRTMHAAQNAADVARQVAAHGRSLNNFVSSNGGKGFTVERETLGWTDCGHDNYAPGVVLDPFAGTGTTLCVADLHGRDGIGIDIDPRNRDLLEPRMAEVRKNLFGVKPELPGQIDLFGESA